MTKLVMRFAMPVMIALLVGCASTQQLTDRASDERSLAPASVVSTTWAGTDSDGDYYEYQFQTNGNLHYKSPTGFWKNGTWKQKRNEIYMETNNKYTERQGIISGNRMEGQAWNAEGRRWTWVAEKK
ncbi:MAG: hypothetical protein BA869_00065 [Desulfuromonadales bacterium C00003107]|nr:MAG: hypothetical protein BA869_00065 [Desulfuromonadales bacterium C00003107]